MILYPNTSFCQAANKVACIESFCSKLASGTTRTLPRIMHDMCEMIPAHGSPVRTITNQVRSRFQIKWLHVQIVHWLINLHWLLVLWGITWGCVVHLSTIMVGQIEWECSRKLRTGVLCHRFCAFLKPLQVCKLENGEVQIDTQCWYSLDVITRVGTRKQGLQRV
jgi:hypothetical protein